MATINPVRDAAPVEDEVLSQAVYTASVANLDDLAVPRDRIVNLMVTPAVLATNLNSLGNGTIPGQELRLVVVVATNALVVPEALGNVDFGGAGDLSVSETASATLIWNSSEAMWRKL